jgi:hypothetical protein
MRWIRARTASEEGYILVVAVAMIAVGLLAAAAAFIAVTGTRADANRQQRSERALQAADAGIASELYRANQVDMTAMNLNGGISLGTVIRQLFTCPIPQVNAGGQVTGLSFTAVASVGQPCPTNSTSGTTSPAKDKEAVGDHDYFEVQFYPGTTNVGDFVEFSPKIVASGVDDITGTDTNKVSRRVEAILYPVTPWRTLEAGNNLTINVPNLLSALGLPVAGTTTFNGTAAAGGKLSINGQGGVVDTFQAANISLSGGLTEPSALDSCTFSQSSITLNLTLGNQRAGVCSGLVNRPTIQISPTKPNCPSSCSSLTGYSNLHGGPEIYNGIASTTVSFAPGDYVFCSFYSAGPVNMNPSWPPSASRGAVRIFIDSPSSSRCSGYSAHDSVTSAGNFYAAKGITNTLAATHPSQAQVYVVGNGSPDGTSVTSTANGLASGQGAFIYAPTSNVTVSALPSCVLTVCTGAGTLSGAVIGWDLTVSATTIAQDLGLLNYPLSSTLGPFRVKQYIECSPQYPLPSPDPTSGC